MLLARVGAAAWRLLTDVRFAVLLIALLALSGLAGVFVRQFPVTRADDPARYAAALAVTRAAWEGIAPFGLSLGPALADLFDAIGLFSVFSSPWFLVLMTVLVVSIACCTLDRTPRLWHTAHDVRVAQPAAFFDPVRGQRAELVATLPPAATLGAVQAAFRSRRFRRQRTAEADGAAYVYGDRNQYQKLATLLTHAGLVLFLAGGALTVASGFETIVFVGEGQSAPVRPIGTPDNLLLKVHDFAAPRRADGSFADFATDLSVYRDGEEVARKTIRVNDPLTVDGYVFHQNTFGPAADLVVRDAAGQLVWDGPLLLDDQIAGRPQGFMTMPGSSVGLVAVLSQAADGSPQLVLQGVGPADPASGENPTLFLAAVPIGVATDPEVTAGHSIEWSGVSSWTGLVVKNDPGQAVIWLAFACLISGLVLSFYFPRRRAWARLADGRLAIAFLADPTVDREREFQQLRDAVELAVRSRPVGQLSAAPTSTEGLPHRD